MRPQHISPINQSERELMTNEVSHEDLYVTARDYLRAEGDGCTVGINDVLEHLEMSFSDQSQMFQTAGVVLKLIEGLWREPHITRPSGWSIDFAWSEVGDGRPEGHRNYPDTDGLPVLGAMRAHVAWRRGEEQSITAPDDRMLVQSTRTPETELASAEADS